MIDLLFVGKHLGFGHFVTLYMEELEPVKPDFSKILFDHLILIVADLLNVAKYLCRICGTCLVHLSFRMQGPKFSSIV